MSDPRDRLRRALPGETIGRERPSVDRLFARAEVRERPEPVPPRDARAVYTLAARKSRKLADATPNAPLLIRIVRHPYGLHPTGRRRDRYLEHYERPEKVDRLAEIAAALAERIRLRFTSAARKRPRPFAVRPSNRNLLPPAEEEP